MEDGNLNELVGIEKSSIRLLHRNKTPIIETKDKDNEHFLGKHIDTGYYFNYDEDGITTLDHTFLSTMKTKAENMLSMLTTVY
ncbi:MAG: hypothetical protein IPP79_09085 [Chitinophagaceae bacterium]|nr:hypothetical protein [Chitinophagaceae bacterium]